MTVLRNAACEYADRGWYVLPLRPGHKQPITRHGKDDATDDLVTVFQWWQSWPDANVGIVANPSGLVILDVDPRHGGDETLAEREREWGSLPPTIEAQTGGGGWHYLFKHPGGALRGKLGEGIDVQDFRYIVAPPSLHPSGRSYTWSVDGDPSETELARLPDEWVDQVRIVTSATSRAKLGASPEGLSPDPLRRIPAATYMRKLTGREANRHGYVQCPLHGGGNERTPSLKVDGTLWACYGCEPLLGKRCQGGNVYDAAALLWGFAAPPRGGDYLEIKDRLRRLFHV